MASEKFLSPAESSSPGSKCEAVLSAWQATFNLDIHGQWSSLPGFQTNSSMYELLLGGVPISDEDYKTEMQKMYVEFEAMGQATANHDLPYAIAALASFRYYSPTYRFQFYSHTDVRKIFNRPPLFGILANSLGDVCVSTENPEGEPIASYDSLTGMLSLYYEDLFEAYAPCGRIFDVTWLFSTDFTATTKFTLSMDIASIQLATAINYGIIKDPANAGLTQVYNGLFGALGVFYVDEFYPDMQPVFCLHDGKNSSISGGACFLYFGSFLDGMGTFMYPLSGSWTDGKSCPDISTGFGLDLLVGGVMMVGRDETFTFGLKAQENITRYGVAEWIHTVNTVLIQVAISGTWKGNSYTPWLAAFCKEYCSIALFEFSWWSQFPSVNRYYVLYNQFLLSDSNRQQYVTDGLQAPLACQNVLFDELMLQTVVNNPPQRLEENYKVCHLTREEAFQRAVGLSMGNAQLYTAVITVVFIFVLAFTLNRRNQGSYANKVKSKWETEELHDAISKSVTLSILDALKANGTMKDEQVDHLSQLLSLRFKPSSARFRHEHQKLGIAEAYLDFPLENDVVIEMSDVKRHVVAEAGGGGKESY
eukprot:gene34872-42228_t